MQDLPGYHDLQGYQCKACGDTFDAKEQLDRHNRQEHRAGADTADVRSGFRAASQPD